MPEDDATGLTFAMSATAEPIDDNRPCAYCNSDTAVAERESQAYEKAAEENLPEYRVPDDVGIIQAEYVLRFGHEKGAGVEVPVCDMCLGDCPVEYEGQTAHSEMDFVYFGDGEIRKKITKTDPVTGQISHRKVPVDAEL